MLRLLLYREPSFGRPIDVAVCVVCKKNDRIQTATHLETALTNACTKWAKQTDEGRVAYNYAGGYYFNFGDLGTYADSESLKPYLKTEGIEDFDLFGFDDNGGMTYNTSLMDEIEEDEEDEDD